MATVIGVRELQQHASRLIREVEQGRAEYRITVQGRDTGVILAASAGPDPAGSVPLVEAQRGRLWRDRLPQDTRRALLAQIEAQRDAMGLVGQ
ncbi:MAG: type II toxin-antitoxin system Phd/YefM family antitoxin [Actinomycetia bacterium]|nr:type II toxin-antitoxin system Phd/YefM family antitoxin [Actinomycetes bacterium]